MKALIRRPRILPLRIHLSPHFLITLAALAVSLFLLEMGLRALDVRPLPVGMGALWETDDELGWKFMPGMQGWVTKPDDGVETWITINSDGLRDTEYSLVPDQDTKRILVLGDSFSAALEVELAETFHELLELMLNRFSEASRYEVINAGVSGYGTAQELLTYRRLVERYHPDVVLLAFVDNDVVDNSYLDPSRVAPVFLPDNTGNLQLRPASGLGQGIVESVKTWLRQHTRLYPVVMSYLHRLLPSTLPRAGGNNGELELASPKEPYELIPSLGLLQEPMPPAYENAWQITEELILMLRDEVEADGACFAVMVIPSHYQVDHLWEAFLHARLVGDEYTWNRSATSERLADYLPRNGIPNLDLTPIFRDRGNLGGESLYLERDGHWNANGHKVAAESLFSWIRENEQLLVHEDC